MDGLSKNEHKEDSSDESEVDKELTVTYMSDKTIRRKPQSVMKRTFIPSIRKKTARQSTREKKKRDKNTVTISQAMWRNRRSLIRILKRLHAKYGYESATVLRSKDGKNLYFLSHEGSSVCVKTLKNGQGVSKIINDIELTTKEDGVKKKVVTEKKLKLQSYDTTVLSHIAETILAHASEKDSEAKPNDTLLNACSNVLE